MSTLQKTLINLHNYLYQDSPITKSDSPHVFNTSNVSDIALTTALASTSRERPVTVINNNVGNGVRNNIDSVGSVSGPDEEKQKTPPSLVGPIISVLFLVPTGAYCLAQIVKTKRMVDDANVLIKASENSMLIEKWKIWKREYQGYYLGCNRSFLGVGVTSSLGLGNYLILFKYPMIQYYINVLLLCLGGGSLGYFCLTYFLRNIESERRKFNALLDVVKEKSE